MTIGMNLGARVPGLENTSAKLVKEAVLTDHTYPDERDSCGIAVLNAGVLQEASGIASERMTSTLLKDFQGAALHFCIVSFQLCKVNLSQGEIPLIKAV